MKNFSENPINLLRYVVSEESALKSDDIVIKAASRYLSLDKPFDDQITQIEQVQALNNTFNCYKFGL